jgi:hypothetical protein
MNAKDALELVKRPGSGDKKVMAYNFRMCMTKNTSNQIPFPEPEEYHKEDWELIRRLFQIRPYRVPSCNTAEIPNGKYDSNNCGAMSSDFLAADYTNKSWRNLTSWQYPEASYATRREIWRVHQNYQVRGSQSGNCACMNSCHVMMLY